MKKMTKYLAILFFGISGNAIAQISILNTNLNSLNITASSLTQVNIMNGSNQELQVIMEAKLMNSANENILTVKTLPFNLAVGMNYGMNLNHSLQSTILGNTDQARYVSTTHTLPSGNFKYCVSVLSTSENEGDDYCEDIVSDISSFLNLIYPYDKDSIDTKNPVLNWTHSEPFNILSPGDHFKLVLVELKNDQNAESGVSVNLPIYTKDFMNTHQVLYPYDATLLKEGQRYGWQVQKISNGTIIDKTESWEFTLIKEKIIPDHKYVGLKKKLDASYYLCTNEKIFFKFQESYSGGELKFRIINEKMEELKPELKNEKDENWTIKNNGANYFELDLSDLNLKKGFYELHVFDSKEEKYVLKFKIE